MNAVNLIPRESHRRGKSLPVSPPTLALIGGLVLALVGAVLYVTASNSVAARTSELAQVKAGVAGWTAAASSYDPVVSTAKLHSAELADVRQLASARIPWSDLLSQIGARMPASAALSTLDATTSSASDGSSTPLGPGVQLTGCAASQSVVAQTMVALRRIGGVTGDSLSTSSDSGVGSGSGAASGSTASAAAADNCPFAVQFQLALTISPSLLASAASAGSASTASAPAASPSTPALADDTAPS